MANVVEEIREMQRKAALYEGMRERYVEYAAALRKVIGELQEILKEIDPAIKGGGDSSRRDWSDALTNLYDKMASGVHLTSEMVRGAYPEVADSDIYNLMTKLKKMPSIDSRKEGTRVYLFHKDA